MALLIAAAAAFITKGCHRESKWVKRNHRRSPDDGGRAFLAGLCHNIRCYRARHAQLAVGGIIGGNAFDVFFLLGAHIAYRLGSFRHVVGMVSLLWVGIGPAVTKATHFGLIIRQRQSPKDIGSDCAEILILSVGAIVLQFSGLRRHGPARSILPTKPIIDAHDTSVWEISNAKKGTGTLLWKVPCKSNAKNGKITLEEPHVRPTDGQTQDER